jgi:hypothetical protein
MMIRAKEFTEKPVIDLTGADGNAFVLLGAARQFAKQLGWSAAKSDAVQQEMMEGDYENLIATFDSYFGNYVILER